MFNNISYNVVVERFKAFADGHFLIRRFTHGQVDQTDLDKDQLFPWMHVAPVEVRAAAGARVFTFDVIFADIPRDKEDKTDYQKESISDCIRLAEDLLSEIQNGQVVFSDLVEVEGESSITPFIEEWTHTLSGCTLALTISVPNDYNACDIPADWSIGGGGGGTPPSPFPPLILKVNNVDNVLQNILNVVDGENTTIEDLGDGRVRINAGADQTGTLVSSEFNTDHISANGTAYVVNDVVWYSGNFYRCIAANDAILPTNTSYWTLVGAGFRSRQSPVDWDANSGDYQILNKPTLATVATTGDYNDLDNLPSIPAAQLPSDWTATTGVTRILNKPTIPSAQVNSDWSASSGVAAILNKPTIPAAQVNSNWTAVSGVAQILNKPTIPANLDDLSDVNAPAPTNGQALIYNTATSQWIASTPAGGGSVSSVGFTAPAAFNVSGSPITTSGTIALTGAGTTAQYIRGNGTLATFPTIPAAQVNSDWNATFGLAEILNKPVIPAAQVNADWNAIAGVSQILNKPTIPAAQIQSDWTQTNNVALDFIKNKPTLPATIGDMLKSVYDTDNDGIVDFAKALKTEVRNSTGATLPKGHIVRLSGSTGNLPNAVYAQANNDANSAQTFGVVYADIANNSNGFVITLGQINTLDTRSTAPNAFTSDTLVDGDVIYLSPTTPGHITNVKPFAPQHIVYVGMVVRTSPTNGTIQYRIQNGYELDELHNVVATAPADNDYLYYEASTSLYRLRQLTAARITDANTVGQNLVKLTNPNAISFIRVNADNQVVTRTPAQVLTDLGVAATIILGRDFAGNTVSNTTTNTVVFSTQIAANTLQANDFIEFISQFSSTAPNGTATTWRVYVNTNPIIGGVQIATWNNAVGTNNTAFLRNIFITAIGASGNLRITGAALNQTQPYINSGTAVQNITINTTADLYIVLAVQMGNATSTAGHQGTLLRLTR